MVSTLTALPARLPPLPPPPPPHQTSHRNLNPLTANLALSSGQPSEAASLLAAAARAGDLRLGRALHRRLLRTEFLDTDAVVANSLLTMYSKCGHVCAAHRVFEGMRGLRDLVSWTAMAFCLARNGQEHEALRMIGEMLESGLRPNAFTLCAAARACFPRELLRSTGGVVLGLVLKTGFWGTDISVGCALIDMFARNGDLVTARKVFDGLIERTVVVWTLMITRYVQGGCIGEAVELFLVMLEDGFEPDGYTMSSMVSACAEFGSVRLGQQLHSLAFRLGLVSDSCVSCGLVDIFNHLNPWSHMTQMPCVIIAELTYYIKDRQPTLANSKLIGPKIKQAGLFNQPRRLKCMRM
uniref:Uncharacterized protein n=1 Tax=Avena sativa TaxID=4498 RepID=A0ACD5TKJ4_AVESA